MLRGLGNGAAITLPDRLLTWLLWMASGLSVSGVTDVTVVTDGTDDTDVADVPLLYQNFSGPICLSSCCLLSLLATTRLSLSPWPSQQSHSRLFPGYTFQSISDLISPSQTPPYQWQLVTQTRNTHVSLCNLTCSSPSGRKTDHFLQG